MTHQICGYAAVFGQVDLAGDLIVTGAFTETLRAADSLPLMLYQHDATRPLGRWLTARETAHGLWVEGQLAENVQLADEAAALIEQSVLTGLSIGFRTRSAQAGNGTKKGSKYSNIKRRLLAIDLVEISLVTFPMQPLARLSGNGLSGNGLCGNGLCGNGIPQPSEQPISLAPSGRPMPDPSLVRAGMRMSRLCCKNSSNRKELP